MRKNLRLKARMRVVDGNMQATCKLVDGSVFEIYPPEHSYGINEEFQKTKEVVDGWVEVVQEGQQGNNCYVTLPVPSYVHGQNVTVSQFELLPITSTLADYGAQVPETEGQVPPSQ